MAINLSRFKGGRPVTDEGVAEEKHFVVDSNFDKEEGVIIPPTSGLSNTIYFTNSLINNARTIDGFSGVWNVSQSGGDVTVTITGEAGSRFTLDGGSGVSIDETTVFELPETTDGSSELTVSGTVGSNSSTSSRTRTVRLIPYILETPETLLADGVSDLTSVSQAGVPATFSQWSVSATVANTTQGTSSAVGSATTFDYEDGDIVTFTYTATLTVGGNQNAFANLSGFLIVPSVHGGVASNYTWTLTGDALSSGPESGTNRPTYQYHLRESESNVGRSFTWSARIDTTGLGTAGSSFTGNFPLYGRVQGTTSGYERRVNFNKTG